MAAKRKTLSLILLVLVVLAAPAAVAHVQPNQTLHPEAIDFLHESDSAAGGETFAVFTNPKLHLLDGVAGIELPRPSIATQLEQRISDRTSIFTRTVNEKLASGLHASLERAIVKEINGLSPKTRWGAENKAAPFVEPATGMVFFRDRWYDASTGTWLTDDPEGYADSSNLYAAFGNDPVNLSDPDGHATAREFLFEGGEAWWDRGSWWQKPIGGLGIYTYSFMNTASAGFFWRNDDFYEAYKRGEISGDEYVSNGLIGSAVRSGVILGVSYATGGIGGSIAMKCGASYLTSMTVAGGLAGFSGTAASDVMDVEVLGDRTSYSSPSTYAFNTAVGAFGGYALGRAHLAGLNVSRPSTVSPIAGDSDFVGPVRNGSWRLMPDRAGAHMVERVNVASRPSLGMFDTAETPRFYPDGTPEAAGRAHLRMHQASDAVGLARSGGNPGMTPDQLMTSLGRAYDDPVLGGIRGSLRTPNGSYVAGRNLGTAQAFSLLKWWGAGGWPRPYWFLYMNSPARRR